MEHGIGSGLPAPDCQARSAEGVMVRRLSVASLDSGAESPVYGEEPSASADRNPADKPPRAGGNGRWAAGGDRAVAGWYLAPRAAISGLAGAADAGGTTALRVPQGRATRHIRVSVGLAIPGQVGTGVPRHATTCDMSVVDQQGARWYVKDIRASTQPMGTQ
jgi:hypothetical protein